MVVHSIAWQGRIAFALVLIALAVGFAAIPFPAFPPEDSPDASPIPAARRTFVLPVQTQASPALAKGKLLVSSEELRDPNFGQSVVLLTDYNEHGAKGVILNRTTRIRLAELLPKVEGLQLRSDTIYEGGPVAREEILMLVRATEELEDARLVLRGVYLSKSAELLRRLAAEPDEANARFRVYSGYAGWGPGQLEAEVKVGAWYIFPATAATVFTTRPQQLWQEFIDRTNLRLARALTAAGASSWGGSTSPALLPARAR